MAKPKLRLNIDPGLEYRLGLDEGRKAAFHELLTWLERDYVHGGFHRDSPEATASLALVRRVGALLREKLGEEPGEGVKPA